MATKKTTTTTIIYDDGKIATRVEVENRTPRAKWTVEKSACPEVDGLGVVWSRADGDGSEWLEAASLDAFAYADHTSIYASGTFSAAAVKATSGILIDDMTREIWWVVSDASAELGIDVEDLDGFGTDLLDAMKGAEWGINVDRNGNLIFNGSNYIFRG